MSRTSGSSGIPLSIPTYGSYWFHKGESEIDKKNI